jgi:IclR family acetate operon transcriptional repressor
MATKDRNPISKALKALSVLAGSRNSEVGVRELAQMMKISPSSAHRILLSLCEDGFVTRDDKTQRYALGIEFLRLAHLTIAKAPIRQFGIEAMRNLVDACNETALLGIYDGSRQQMIFAASVDSSHTLRYVIELNTWIPVYTGASGQAIMAFLDEEEIQSIIRRTRLSPLTPRSITEPYRLEADLATIRRQGYAFSLGQRIVGAVGLAAPIFSSNGKVLGDICLTIPEQRFDKSSKTKLIDKLLGTANTVTERLRGTDRTSFAA